MAIRRTESQFEGSDRRFLFRRAWLPPDPHRLLVLVHGYAEHSGRYDHVGTWFGERGYAVHAYDQRGHGRSDGRRCHVERFSEYLDDAEIFLAAAGSEHVGLPTYLLGHSMGGLVVATLLVERKPEIQAAITSGAALQLSPDISRGRTLLARFARRLFPKLTLESGFDPEGLSRDPAVVRAYLEDPFVHRRMTLSHAAELLAAVERIEGRGAEVRLPLLVLHGEDDPICPVGGSRAFHQDLRTPESELRTYPGLRHEIFNEPEQLAVFQDILDWIERPGGAA